MNNFIVKEPEELILMKGDFSESALKFGAYLIANLEKDKVIYNLNVKDYLEKFDKKIGDYNYLYSVVEELSQKQFKMNDRFNNKFSIFNFIASANYADGVLKIEFSSILLTYLLEVKEKYLKYNLENIMTLSSKYAIRLYKILKDSYETYRRYSNLSEKKLKVTELREILNIPTSYMFGDVKRQILEKAKTDLEQHTDIIFDYEEIKTGRKVTHLKFTIRANPAKTEAYKESKITKHLKSIKYFVSFLRKNYVDKCFGYILVDENIACWLKINDKGLVYGTLDNGEQKHFNSLESERMYRNWLEIAKADWFYQRVILEDIEDFKEFYNKELDFRLNFKETIALLQEENKLK